MKPIIYVVVNKGLRMSPGKLGAQVGHAVMGLTADTTHGSDWSYHPQRWMIILEGEDASHLLAIEHYLTDRKVPTYLVLDEGVNEIRPFSYTALAVGPLIKDSEQAGYLAGLKKYSYDPYADVDDRHLNAYGRFRKTGRKPWWMMWPM